MAKREILPYRSHFVRDWAMSETVRVMNFAARGIYQALLDMQWENESIPESPDQCRRLIGCDPEEWAAFEPFLDQCFPLGEDGRRRNPRTAHERAETELRWEKQRMAGQASGKSRSKVKGPQNQPKAKPEHQASEPEASDERMLNGCSTDVQRTLNHTNTDTFTLANASGASHDAPPSNVIDLEVVRSEPIEPPEPEVIEAEVVLDTPYAVVERIMVARAKATNQPMPTPPMVRRHIAESSAIRRLVQFCGEAKATKLLVWCAVHKPRLSFAGVFSEAQSLLAEAEKARWGSPGGGGKGWGDPADDVERMVDEHEKLLAARAEEDRYIRENW